MNQTKLLFPLIFISLEDDSSIVIPTQPTSPGEIMSGGEGEPVEADVPAEDETVAPQEMHVTGTQTVTHEYLTLNGKVARETIRTNNTLTAVLDFIYALSRKGNADAPGQRTGMQLVVSFRQCAACRALPDPDITPRQHGKENTMKLIWTRELDVQNPWEPDFHGVFFYQESGISFYYKDEHLVRCVHGQMDEPEILFEGKRGIRGSTI